MAKSMLGSDWGGVGMGLLGPCHSYLRRCMRRRDMHV
jgi:hypothetical protein